MAETEFEVNNRAYLDAALRWLRAVLRARASQLAPNVSENAISDERTVDSGPWWLGKRGRKEPLALPAPPESDEMKTARAALDAAAGRNPPPGLVALAKRLGLSSYEQQMLLLCVALELDPDMPAWVAAAQGDPARRAPTFALGMTLFGDARWDALAPGRPLRRLCLLELHQVGSTSLIGAPLRIDERIAAFIKGLNYLDERIAALASVVRAPKTIPESQHVTVDLLERWMTSTAPAGIVQVTGPDSASKRDVLAAACARAGRVLLTVPEGSLPHRSEDADHWIHLWTRESSLLPVALLVDGVDAARRGAREDREGRHESAGALGWLQRLPGPVFIDVPEPSSGIDDLGVLEVGPPQPEERKVLWRDALLKHGFAEPADAGLERLAYEFRLSASRIARVAGGTLTMPASRPEDGVAFAWDACIANAAGDICGLAQRIDPRATVDDVKLPPHDKAQLERLIEHSKHRAAVLARYGFGAVANRGLGLAALFHGESGTGKTMAAEAVARALDLALFRVDLSSVVSKYIGETSKNLRRVFDAADGGGAVLLFDEADAVFGRRSEVKDSHDRYANIDINYLLTRMEGFGGVTILATNMRHALDPAFLRRLRFIVGFPFPGVAERKAIWERVIPEGAPTETLDLDRLARFALTGGSIFNAALAAAHAAASAGGQITMPLLLEAIRWELVKMERPVSESEFRWTARPGASAEKAA